MQCSLNLLPERSCYLIRTPVHLNLTGVHILINADSTIVHIAILRLTFLEDLEHEISADCWIIGIAKVLIDSLLERFNAFLDFFRIVRVN